MYGAASSNLVLGTLDISVTIGNGYTILDEVCCQACGDPIVCVHAACVGAASLIIRINWSVQFCLGLPMRLT